MCSAVFPLTVERGLAGPPAGEFSVTGKVADKLVLSVAELAALPLPSHTVTVTFQSGSSQVTRTFTGPLLDDVLQYARPMFNDKNRNDRLRFYVNAYAGSDGYQAIVAWGEIDPGFENKEVLLAVTEDGVPLDEQGPRLVVPGDIRGGRYVTGSRHRDPPRARQLTPDPASSSMGPTPGACDHADLRWEER